MGLDKLVQVKVVEILDSKKMEEEILQDVINLLDSVSFDLKRLVLEELFVFSTHNSTKFSFCDALFWKFDSFLAPDFEKLDSVSDISLNLICYFNELGSWERVFGEISNEFNSYLDGLRAVSGCSV